ncbi:hypothetical protein SSP531S_05340 [Streptomyces spongiicola]|uniref:Uncharacterized protein n=1 Tax=Streptomyces spongiicola TaxID=1690221 RepID=A0A388STS8_9ACTN|nr:hypothetical protein SSP531S_05340 [Streptomyces spongiicola]
MVVELQFLLGGEVAADPEVGCVPDQRAFEGYVETVARQLAGFQGDEGVPAEQPGAYGRPFGHARRVVEVHLVHGPDPGAVAVERLAADQAARIDVGLHGPSNRSHGFAEHYESAHPGRRPLESAG